MACNLRGKKRNKELGRKWREVELGREKASIKSTPPGFPRDNSYNAKGNHESTRGGADSLTQNCGVARNDKRNLLQHSMGKIKMLNMKLGEY